MSKKLFFLSIFFLIASIILNMTNLIVCYKNEKKYSEKVIAELTSESTHVKDKITLFDVVNKSIQHLYNFEFSYNNSNFECSFVDNEVPLLERANLCRNNQSVLLVNPNNPTDAIFSQSLKKTISSIFVIIPLLLVFYMVWYYININQNKKRNSTKQIIIRPQIN